MTETENPIARFSQSQIQQALLSLMKKTPYAEITVKEILYEAKIARKTFYRNFISKDDALNSIVKIYIKNYEEGILNLTSEDLTDFFEFVFAFVEDNLAFFNILCKNKLVHIFFEELNASIPVFHKKFCADCSFFNNLTQAQTEYAIAFNIGAIWNIILKWTSDGMKIPKKKIISGIVKYLDFLHG